MHTKRVVLSVSMVVGALALAGCTGGSDGVPLASPESAVAPASAASTTDEVMCTAFGDVLTIVANADSGLRDGRMEAQEQRGWYRLATRVLDRIPTRGEGAVSDTIDGLKAAAPVAPPAAAQETGIRSADWESGVQTLSDACAVEGAELALEMFTGG